MLDDFNFDSFSHGQIKSKLWLCDALKSCWKRNFNHALFLGSWYGILPFLLLAKENLSAQKLTMLDLDENALKKSKKILDYWHVEGLPLSFLNCDARHVDYQSEAFRDVDLVFNTSCEHMDGISWFDQIPDQTWVVLQGTNMEHHEHIFPFQNLEDFRSKFSNLEVTYAGRIGFNYPDKTFERYMVIGQKQC